VYDWVSRSEHKTKTGFLQWKPVCYQSLKRTRDKATSMKHYGLQGADKTLEALNHTIAYWFFGDKINGLMMQMQNFSFGIPKDGGYSKTQVLGW